MISVIIGNPAPANPFPPGFPDECLVLFLIGLVLSCLLMAAIWLVAVRIRNAGIVDIAWALGFAPLALLYRFFGDGEPLRQDLITLMVVVWSVRLGFHLWKRVMGHHPQEDGRYEQLRNAVAGHENFFFFWFFQAQAVLLAFLSIPMLLSNFDARASRFNSRTSLDSYSGSLRSAGSRLPTGSLQISNLSLKPRQGLLRRSLAIFASSQLLF